VAKRHYDKVSAPLPLIALRFCFYVFSSFAGLMHVLCHTELWLSVTVPISVAWKDSPPKRSTACISRSALPAGIIPIV